MPVIEFWNRTIFGEDMSVLQPLIPDLPPSSYDLRRRTHDKLLLNKTSYLNDRDFVIRMLYRDSYWLLYISINYVSTFF